MFSVKGEGKELEVYMMFNFKIFGYNIWPRFNDTIYCNGIIFNFIIND